VERRSTKNFMDELSTSSRGRDLFLIWVCGMALINSETLFHMFLALTWTENNNTKPSIRVPWASWYFLNNSKPELDWRE
jgi:hypothetical protein